jgi:hypothetical protein
MIRTIHYLIGESNRNFRRFTHETTGGRSFILSSFGCTKLNPKVKPVELASFSHGPGETICRSCFCFFLDRRHPGPGAFRESTSGLQYQGAAGRVLKTVGAIRLIERNRTKTLLIVREGKIDPFRKGQPWPNIEDDSGRGRSVWWGINFRSLRL